MGKIEKKNHKHEEHFLGTIREQKAEIKRLNQTIRRLEKELGYGQNRSKDKRPRIETEDTPDCPECAKGFLKELNLVNRIYMVCAVCKYRAKVK